MPARHLCRRNEDTTSIRTPATSFMVTAGFGRGAGGDRISPADVPGQFSRAIEHFETAATFAVYHNA